MGQLDKEMKEKENFATGNYPNDALILGAKGLRDAERAALKGADNQPKKKKPLLNYISPKEHKAEVAKLPFEAASNLIIVIGPKIEQPTHDALKLDETTANKLKDEKIDALGEAFKVVAISQSMPTGTVVRFEVGDYIIWQGPLARVLSFAPQDTKLAFYQVRLSDLQYIIPAAKAEAFKPVETEA